MAREIQTEGVVLRRWYTGEHDKWISLLTPEHGRLRVRVRGARKPKSKMGMLTEPLNRLKARVIEGKAQRLMAQPQLVRSYVQVRSDLERLSVALALCETLDRWLPEEHAEPEAYGVLVIALEVLEAGAPVELAAAWALWRWLAMLGYCPDVERCGGCGKELSPSLFEPADFSNLTPLSPLSARREGGTADAQVSHSPSPFSGRGLGGEVEVGREIVESASEAKAEPPTYVKRTAWGEGEIKLLPTDGVLLCSQCAPRRDGIVLASDAIALLQRWTQGESLSLDSRPEAYRDLMRAALRYAECVLESPVRWLEFWERLSALRESG